MADQSEYLQRLAYAAYDRGFMEKAHNLKLHTFAGFVKMYWPEIEKSCAWAKSGSAAPALPSDLRTWLINFLEGCSYLTPHSSLDEVRNDAKRLLAALSSDKVSKEAKRG